jgi:NADH-quinone oxidoreductase subunit I
LAYPVLFHDDSLNEPACTGCMACVNYCPTECISATVRRNPVFVSGSSSRKTIAASFEVDLSKCIECGICVDMCDYEAIALGVDEVPAGAKVVGLDWLEARGREYERRVGHDIAVTKPDVTPLLEAVRGRLPPASTSDGARRAWSRLRTSKPMDVRMDRRPD